MNVFGLSVCRLPINVIRHTHQSENFSGRWTPFSSLCRRDGGIWARTGSVRFRWTCICRASGDVSGLYSARTYELNSENVNLVLDDVRPYLISDGGDVEVVSVVDGFVSLKLKGACETCPSSTTTMTMGIERVLKEKFGDQIKDICQVFDDPQIGGTTVEAINAHLDILRPAIKNYGGSAEVISVDGGDCTVNYVGPGSIGSGIKAAIKEKFPDIVKVILVSNGS